jgi:hypothetical protein
LDIAKGEATEKELDAMISRRDAERRKSEGKRAREQLWVESVRRHHKSHQANHWLAWCDYERRMRDLHWSLGDEHDHKLRKLENGHRKETA